MSDRLALANAIEDAGIERGKAERVASVIVDLIHDSVATKADVQGGVSAVPEELQSSAALLRLELSQMEYRLTRNGIAALVVAVGFILGAMLLLGHPLPFLKT